MCELGWKSLGVLELTALPSIDEAPRSTWLRRLTRCWWEAAIPVSVLLDAAVRTADLLPSLREAVYVGLSAGSMVMAPVSGGLRRLEAAHRWRQHAGTG